MTNVIDPATAVSAVNVTHIFVNILLGLATALGTTVVPYLLLMLRKWLKSKLNQGKHQALLSGYSYLSTITYDVVKAAQETFVKELKEKSADGRLTKEEAVQIKQKVIADIQATAGSQAINAIGEDGAGVTNLINNLIESMLAGTKSETTCLVAPESENSANSNQPTP